MNQFQVQVEKEDLIFSAAHFITFADNVCESLHGHNYRVRCRVTGDLKQHGYVIDFIALQSLLKAIVRQLDHHVLLPTQHTSINVEEDAGEVHVRFEDRRWIFPAADCVLLPVDNTTAERLAEFIGVRLLANAEFDRENLSQLEVAVDENEGQWGIATFSL